MLLMFSNLSFINLSSSKNKNYCLMQVKPGTGLVQINVWCKIELIHFLLLHFGAFFFCYFFVESCPTAKMRNLNQFRQPSQPDIDLNCVGRHGPLGLFVMHKSPTAPSGECGFDSACTSFLSNQIDTVGNKNG